MTLAGGTRLGPYEILSAIGAGGMGEVYKARDTRLGRDVAIKVLPPDVSTDPERRARFEREAKAIAGLNHPHICTLHDIGEHEGSAFLVMELLEGVPLRASLAQARPAVPAVVDICLQLADALEAAHAKGIVHRDVKPENIFITTRAAAKLLDFGIAKLAAAPAAETALTVPRTATGPLALGTVAYMSPEQVRGEPVDARTDLFSLGVVLYELLTGRQPFRGATSGAVLGEILTKTPTAPARFGGDVTPELERVVNKLLEKDRELRYQSARDLRLDLERLRRMLRTPAAARSEEASIIVLPFEDISPGRDNEYFADGLTEEVIADLSHIGALRVISRTSAMMFKGARKAAQQIGRELDVRYLLEGSVRKAGNNLRITAQLIDTATDRHVWADKYAGTLEDVFEMQEKVSRAIVAGLKMRLTMSEDERLSRRGVGQGAAFDLYLRARNGIREATQEGLDAAVRCLEQGLRETGESALLHAGLGYAHAQRVNFAFAGNDAIDKAVSHASRALQLDPDTAQGYLVLALVGCLHGDHQESIRQLDRAMVLEPADSDVLYWLGIEYACVGRVSDITLLLDRLVAVDPLHPDIHTLKAWVHWSEGQFDQAAECAEQARRLLNHAWSRFTAMFFFACAGRKDRALAALDGVVAPGGEDVSSSLCKFMALALRGEAGALPALLTREFVAWSRRDGSLSYMVAAFYMLAGEVEQGLEWLDNAVSRGFIPYPYLRDHEPFFTTVRGDPRFELPMAHAKRQWEAIEV